MPSENQPTMERLSFADSEPHQAIEAAVHLGRYLLAKPYCKGRKVLDVACGEGYGAFFMARRWGAREVHGVDVSGEAIARARKLFGGDAITFHEKGVEDLDGLFPEGAFDVAVSLETIEHLGDPARFLSSLRRAVRPGGAIILSCPNDHWYYRSPDQGNPFHARKYAFDEFQKLAQSELGPARRWAFGTPLFGYMNAGVDSGAHGRAASGRLALLEAHHDVDVLLVPADEAIESGNCSYFVGIWGDPPEEEPLAAGALYPCSMDSIGAAQQRCEALRAAMGDEQQKNRAEQQKHRAEQQKHLAEVLGLRDAAERGERERGHLQLRLSAAVAELELLRERVAPLHDRLQHLERRYRYVSWLLENEAVVQTGRRAKRIAKKVLRR